MSLKNLLLGTQKLEQSKASFKESVQSFKKEINEAKEKIGLNRTAKAFVDNAQFENVLVIKMRSASFSSDGKEYYQIFNPSGKQVYMANMATDLITNRDVFKVYNTQNGTRKIGEVKQWLASTRLSLFEKDAKSCSVILEKETLCILKKCVSLGELEYQTLEGFLSVSIESDDDYSISFQGKEIAKIHSLPFNLREDYTEHFVIEYQHPQYEQAVILLSIAIDVVSQ